jgi:cystathionine gamma-lyase
MLSFRINGGKEAAERFCQATQIFVLAESLGGVESLCEVPSAMTHSGIPQEAREKVGVWDDLIRLSCGIEDGEDLKRDLLQALEKAVVWPKINGANVSGDKASEEKLNGAVKDEKLVNGDA